MKNVSSRGRSLVSFRLMLWRIVVLIIGITGTAQAIAEECDMIGVRGMWWKGTSTYGVNVNIQSQEWLGNASGQGRYRVSLNITMDQGVKYYMSSPNNSNWSSNILPADGIVPFEQTNCMEGYSTFARAQDLSVGGGVLKIYLADVGAESGSQEMRLISENDPGAVRTIETIHLYKGDYMVGIANNGDFQTTKSIDVLVDALNIQPGNYSVSIPINLAGTSTWFMSGANNWWTSNPAGTPDYKESVYLPLDIRIDDTGEPGNPDVICSLSTTDITLSHGNILYNKAQGNIKQESFSITCDGETTADIMLQGNNNTQDSYTEVNMGPGPGLTSQLSVSLDQTTWSRTLAGTVLINGASTFYLQSNLQAGSDLLPGSYTGSAVAIVNII